MKTLSKLTLVAVVLLTGSAAFADDDRMEGIPEPGAVDPQDLPEEALSWQELMEAEADLPAGLRLDPTTQRVTQVE